MSEEEAKNIGRGENSNEKALFWPVRESFPDFFPRGGNSDTLPKLGLVHRVEKKASNSRGSFSSLGIDRINLSGKNRSGCILRMKLKFVNGARYFSRILRNDASFGENSLRKMRQGLTLNLIRT